MEPWKHSPVEQKTLGCRNLVVLQSSANACGQKSLERKRAASTESFIRVVSHP